VPDRKFDGLDTPKIIVRNRVQQTGLRSRPRPPHRRDLCQYRPEQVDHGHAKPGRLAIIAATFSASAMI